MRLLDLFCGVGGAAMGYHCAGFEVIGVDRRPQPHYPFEFHHADAFHFVEQHGHEFDVIHASPPCQAYARIGKRCHHPALLNLIRDELIKVGKPWIIENVIGAPIQSGVILCGTMFGLQVWRHRYFETRDLLFCPLRCAHDRCPKPYLVSGKGASNEVRHRKGIKSEWPTYLGIPWALPEECTQAVPPAYTEWIGRQIMAGMR